MITLEADRGVSGDADPWRAVGLSRSGLATFLRGAQRAVGLKGAVDVLLAHDRRLRQLNREFRGKDKATDVLSFPAMEVVAAEHAGRGHAGDVAISLETAARQAAEHGHSLRDEVRVLLLHGLLHLSGMDHERDGGEMAEREAQLRTELRLPSGLIARAEGSSHKVSPLRKKSRFLPFGKLRAGMTERKAEAKSRFPSGMTKRKATTRAKATTKATATTRVKSGGRVKRGAR